jgi:pimeloyl-ACP methyl ester carboxylesterase
MHQTIELLAHTDSGVGNPAVVFLPGWCGGREVFTPLLHRTVAAGLRGVSIDWRGHGESVPAVGDFGTSDLVADAIAIIDRLDLDTVVPVALSHASWVALELRRALGPRRVPGVVLLDWMPFGPPPGFLEALDALQHPAAWRTVREQLFAMWADGVDDVSVHAYVESMADYGFDMWSRAGREIAQAFRSRPAPLAALADPVGDGVACPTLHLYAQPRDDAYLAAQQAFAAEHEWFSVRRLYATSHFPCLEVPYQVAGAVSEFVAGLR